MGNGGTLRMDVFGDVGGVPGGPSMASFQRDQPMVDGRFQVSPIDGGSTGLASGSFFGFLPFSSPIQVQAGQILHVVFSNPSPEGEFGNNYAIDLLATRQIVDANAPAQDTSVAPGMDWDLLIRGTGSGRHAGYSTGGQWRSCASQSPSSWCWGSNGANYWMTPIGLARYSDGFLHGLPYDYYGLGASFWHANRVGNGPNGMTSQRQTFSVTTATPIDQIAVRILPTSPGVARLSVRRLADNAVMASVDVGFGLSPAGLFASCRFAVGPSGAQWDVAPNIYGTPSSPTCGNNGLQIKGTFAPVTLAPGDYAMTFEALGAAQYGIQAGAMSGGTAYGWIPAQMPGEFQTQTNGSRWSRAGANIDAFAYVRIATQ